MHKVVNFQLPTVVIFTLPLTAEPFDTKDEAFDLSLIGESTDVGFKMTGYSPSGREIVIHAFKLANIDLSDN